MASSSTPPKQLYHYTSTAGANGIRRDGVIRATVVLSSLKPEDHYRPEILQSIHGQNVPQNYQNRADNVVLVDGSKLDSSKLRQFRNNAYEYRSDIQVNPQDVIDKPRCQRSGASPPQTSPGPSTSYGAQAYYHYTNTGGARQIKSAGRIRGPCTITGLKPQDFYRDEILKRIYGNTYDPNKYATMAYWCVIVNGNSFDKTKLRSRQQDVFDYNGDIAINSWDVKDKPRCTKGTSTSTWNPADDNKYLYHYTNTAGARAIKAARFLKKSGSSGAFGVGVYMTDLKPTDFFRDDILKNNYGAINAAFKGHADWVVRVDKTSLVSNKLTKVGQAVTGDGNRSIYKYSDIIPVQANQVFDKPKCHRAQ